MEAIEPPVMLTLGIHAAYQAGIAALDKLDGAERIGAGQSTSAPNRCSGALFQTTAQDFIADRALGHEVFGAAVVIVRCPDAAVIADVIASLEGQLTAAIQLEPDDEAVVSLLLPLLASRAGRVLANGWPTGVEVTHAMVHGGPFPATADGRMTSVGTLALTRFLRPVSYQDIPDPLLPPALQVANPWQLPRRIDGKWEA